MKRRFHSLAVVGLRFGLLGLLGVLALGAPHSAAADAPRAQLRAFACQPALDPPNRSLAVTAVMRPLPGTQKLELKFDLLVARAGVSGPSVVRAGDLGVWFSPKNPTLGQLPGDVWNFQKSVVELAAPATYRFRVSFRWVDVNGQVIGSAVRYSRRCHQRELRPDLVVSSIAVAPVSSTEDQYTAVINNAGATAAGPFWVGFVNADGSEPPPRTVTRLGAYQTVRETFIGPPCATAGPPTITVDPAQQVDDLNRANNTLTAVCPATTPTGAFSASRYTR